MWKVIEYIDVEKQLYRHDLEYIADKHNDFWKYKWIVIKNVKWNEIF